MKSYYINFIDARENNFKIEADNLNEVKIIIDHTIDFEIKSTIVIMDENIVQSCRFYYFIDYYPNIDTNVKVSKGCYSMWIDCCFAE